MSRSRESSLGSVAMEEEDDDLYGTGPDTAVPAPANGGTADDMEEGEEDEDDDEDDESDIEIVTERPDLGPEATTASRSNQKPADGAAQQQPSSTAIGAKSELPTRAQPATIRIAPDTSSHPVAQAKPVLLPGDKYPAIRMAADLNLDAIPLWNGTPVTELDIDADLAEQMKPWRRPGADQADYFNYGFDEFSWTLYCQRQKAMKDGINAQDEDRKMMESFLGSGGGGGGGGEGGGMGNMPGMPPMPPGMSPEDLQTMMMTMQQQSGGGMDPAFIAFMNSQMGGAGGDVGMGGGNIPTGPSGGGQQGWDGQGQQGGYGGGDGGGGGRRGRGRGRGRW